MTHALRPDRRPTAPLLVALVAGVALSTALGTLVGAPAAGAPATGTPAGTPAGVVATTTTLTLTGPGAAYVDTEVTVAATLIRDDTGAPVAGAAVRFERRRAGTWRPLAETLTDASGVATASLQVLPDEADNRVRASYDGSTDLVPTTSTVLAVTPRRRETVLRLTGPDRIVDETAVSLRLRWRTRGGLPVPGRVTVQVRSGGDWRRHDRLRLGADGLGRVRVSPRRDSRWRAVGEAGRWWRGDTSPVHALDNVPPGVPVAYPAAAPRPRISLPPQQRAVGAGPNGRSSRIPDGVWRSMTGRSWHAGCPVGREALRLVRVNYWGYDGYRRRGELVVRADIAGKTIGAFSALYRAQLPVRAMYRVDRFGWSSYLEGGDNYRSMAAGNTSGFNCRGVVGNPGVPSPHSYGRAIDLNTWENPFYSRQGIVPNTWWATRSHPRIAWRSGSHPVVRIMRAHGFRWTYGTRDSQHFDG